jgi:hypothetical protein
MQWKKVFATASLFGALCVLACAITTYANAQTPVCDGYKPTDPFWYSKDSKMMYYTSCSPLRDDPRIPVTSLYAVKIPKQKPADGRKALDGQPRKDGKQLTNLHVGPSKNRMIVPAPTSNPKWSPDGHSIAFADPGSSSVWIFMFSKNGGDVSPVRVDYGSSPEWTPGGNITYRAPDGALRTFPVPK